MKLLIPFLLLFALGSCTETIYEEVIKTVRDTIKVPSVDTVFIDRVFWKVDTVELRTVTTETDTFFIATIDSVFITQTVYETDTVTIYKITETFRDTFPYFPGRTAYFVPDEVQPIVNAFYQECVNRGLAVTGGNLFITLWPEDDFPPVNRSSRVFSTWTTGQWVIQVRSDIPYENYFSPVMRELAHSQLNKPYSNIPGDPMNPALNPYLIGQSSSEEEKEAYLNKLFEPI